MIEVEFGFHFEELIFEETADCLVFGVIYSQI